MSEMNPSVMASEIAKVNEAMAKEEKNVEKAYLEIGKLYVALHASDYEKEFKPMFVTIENAEKAIRECRERVREIRGVVCCDKCGSDMPKGNAFCSVCGAALTTEAAAVNRDHLVKCEVCGKYVEKDTSFCTSCGMPMKPILERVEAPVEEPAPVVEEPTTVAEEEIDFDKTVIAPSVFAKAETTVAVPEVEETPVEEEPTPAPAEEPVPAPTPVIDDIESTVAAVPPRVVQPPVVDDLDATTAAQRPVAAANTCPRCGAAVRPGMLFCTACGQKMATPAAAPAAASAATKTCTKCGKEIAANAKFCIGCGSRVE